MFRLDLVFFFLQQSVQKDLDDELDVRRDQLRLGLAQEQQHLDSRKLLQFIAFEWQDLHDVLQHLGDRNSLREPADDSAQSSSSVILSCLVGPAIAVDHLECLEDARDVLQDQLLRTELAESCKAVGSVAVEFDVSFASGLEEHWKHGWDGVGNSSWLELEHLGQAPDSLDDIVDVLLEMCVLHERREDELPCNQETAAQHLRQSGNQLCQ